MSERKSFGPSAAGLMLLPLAMLLLFPALLGRNGPYFLGVNSDPDYAYSMNALAVRNGHSPRHWDHPGSTVQALGGLTLRAMQPFLGGDEAAARMVADPESHMRVLAFVLASVCAALIALAGVLVAFALGNIWAGIAFQAIPFFNGVLWEHVVRYMPDVLVLSLALVFTALALRFSVEDEEEGAKKPALLGIVFGLILATKITGALVGLLAVALFRKNWRAYVYFAAGALLTCVPIVALVNRHELKSFVHYFARWIFHLSTRQGVYGSGAVGAPPLAKIWSGFVDFCIYVPAFMAIVAFAAAAAFLPALRRAREGFLPKRVSALANAAIAISALQILVTTKQANQRYLIPAFALASLALVLVSLPWWGARRTRIGAGLAGFALLVAFTAAFAWIRQGDVVLARQADIAAIERKAAETGCEIVPTYRSTSLPFALGFGNVYTGFKFTEALASAYPGFLMYDAGEGFVDFARQPVSPEALRATGKKYCIRGHKIASVSIPPALVGRFRALPILETAEDDTLHLVEF